MGDKSNVQEIITFITSHPVMVLGTANKEGQPHGAAVYIYTESLDWLYLVTKTETQKFKNIIENPHISLTGLDIPTNSCLQITGHAQALHNAESIERVMSSMSRIYARGGDWLPPIAKFRAGPYQVVGVKLQYARLAHFKGAQPGDPHIFIEVKGDDL